MHINLDEISTGNFLQESGTFEFKIIDVELKKKDDGTEQHIFTFEESEGRGTIRYFCPMTEKALFKWKNLLLALGHPAKGTVDATAVSKGCVGRTLRAEVGYTQRLNPATGIKEPSQYVDVLKVFPA